MPQGWALTGVVPPYRCCFTGSTPAHPTPPHPPCNSPGCPSKHPLSAQWPPCSVLCEGELELRPAAGFLDQHGPAVSADLFLDASMRRTATSWLVEVAAEFGLHQETLFLGVALLDRFLSASKVRGRREARRRRGAWGRRQRRFARMLGWPARVHR